MARVDVRESYLLIPPLTNTQVSNMSGTFPILMGFPGEQCLALESGER